MPRFATILGLVLLAAHAPLALAGGPTMSSLWPNDDGRSWTYQSHYEAVSPPEVVDQTARLTFDGTTVAPTSVAAQYLREQLLSGPATTLTFAENVSSPLLRNLWLARPDLREAIEQYSVAMTTGGNPCPEFAPPGGYNALLLGGEFAYVKTGDEIAAWRCNMADTRSWLWLVSDLSIGNTFSLQLVPDLASNVYLHGTIAAFEDVTVPAGTYSQCLRVDYVVDYGTSNCTDQNGTPVGTIRSETRGFVDYAPGVGPVKSSEGFVLYAEVTGDCGSSGPVGLAFSQITRTLAATPVPVVATTWGRIKTIYR